MSPDVDSADICCAMPIRPCTAPRKREGIAIIFMTRNKTGSFRPSAETATHQRRTDQPGVRAVLPAQGRHGQSRGHRRRGADPLAASARWSAVAGCLPALIEGSDLEIAIGEWVITAALTQVATWQQRGLNLPVSVNISAGHLLQPSFAQRLEQLLAEHPECDPGCLRWRSWRPRP
jgi:hypothetical protein